MRKVTRVLAWIIIIAVIVYGGIIIIMLTQETRLVYYVNYEKPEKYSPPDGEVSEYQRFDLKSKDGTDIAGWIIPADGDTLNTFPWMIFCHGNQSDISAPDYVKRYKMFTSLGLNVLTFDYRGFGESGGKPTEKGLYEDATQVYNYLIQSRNIQPERIIIYGHSLGSGVAVDLASRVPAGGLIIEAAYRSVPDIGQKLYPFLPMKLILKNRFMTIDKIDKISYPKMIIHSSNDEIISIAEGKALYDKAQSPKSFLEITGTHVAAPIESKAAFCSGILSFVEEVISYATHAQK